MCQTPLHISTSNGVLVCQDPCENNGYKVAYAKYTRNTNVIK